MKRKNKVPITFSQIKLSVPNQRVYIAYLWFKSLTTSDRLPKKGLKHHKNKVSYWGKKLVSTGLIEDCGDYYRIKSYQKVWSQLRVPKVLKEHGGKGWRHTHLDIDNRDFLKDGLTTYHQYLTKRKKRQIVAVLAVKMNKSTYSVKKYETCRLSCKSVANMLGYKSDITGQKYRKKFFKVRRPKDRKAKPMSVSTITSSGIFYNFRVPCYSVRLD